MECFQLKPPPKKYSPSEKKVIAQLFINYAYNFWLHVFVLYQHQMLELFNRRHYFSGRVKVFVRNIFSEQDFRKTWINYIPISPMHFCVLNPLYRQPTTLLMCPNGLRFDDCKRDACQELYMQTINAKLLLIQAEQFSMHFMCVTVPIFTFYNEDFLCLTMTLSSKNPNCGYSRPMFDLLLQKRLASISNMQSLPLIFSELSIISHVRTSLIYMLKSTAVFLDVPSWYLQ